MSCEMQLNFFLNVHVAVHSCTFQRNKMCILISEHPVCVLYAVDTHTHIYIYISTAYSTHTHTQKDTHRPTVSAAHNAVTLHVSYRHT